MTTFFDRPIPSMHSHGQPGYDVDPLHPQLYPPGYMNPGPPGGRGILLGGPAPYQYSMPQYPHQQLPGQYILPSSNVLHIPHSGAGDLHSSAYAEMDMNGYPPRRIRRPMGGIPMSPGAHFAYPGSPMSQQMNQMDYQYCAGNMMEVCMFCQANHPTPHPLIQSHQHISQMMSVMGRPHERMDELMSGGPNRFLHHGSRRMETAGPMFDPMDGSGPWNANFNRRGSDYDNNSLGKRSRSTGPRRPMPGLIEDLRIAEVSDSEDDEEMMTRGRPGATRRSGLSRRGSMARMRSSSRAGSRPPSNPAFI